MPGPPCAVGGNTHTAVQLNMALNVNYQPFGTGAHGSKRQDVKKEWARFLPKYDQEFEALVGKIAVDAREPAPRSLVGCCFDCRGGKGSRTTYNVDISWL